MRIALSVSGLAKAFGALRVTDNVSFDVLDGEILGIIGGNGAGKTTLFALLAGNIRADAGRIEFRGLDVTELPPHRRARADRLPSPRRTARMRRPRPSPRPSCLRPVAHRRDPAGRPRGPRPCQLCACARYDFRRRRADSARPLSCAGVKLC